MVNTANQPQPPSIWFRVFWIVLMFVGSYHFANRSTQDAGKLEGMYEDLVGSKEHLSKSVYAALRWQHELGNHFEWFLLLILIMAILIWRLRSSLAVALTSLGVVVIVFVQGFTSIMMGSSQMPELLDRMEKMERLQKTNPTPSSNPAR